MKNYRPDIDGLRAVAVLSVVLFHFEPKWFTGGFSGVDIFFVISGYLISTIIFSSSFQTPFSFKRFYFNRAKRILPALLLTMFVTVGIGFLVLLKDELAQLGNHLVAAASFNSNFQLWREAGYFDAKSEMKPLLHLWSLAVEEQFYFIWPVLFLFIFNKSKRPMLWILLSIAASFLMSIKKINANDQIGDFYSPLTRFWEILFGGLLAYINLFKSKLFQRMDGRFNDLISLLGITMCGFSFVCLDRYHFFPGYWVIFPVLGAFLIIAAGQNAWLNRALLSHPYFVFVGLISYPLYLWHWPILSFLQIIYNGAASIAVRLMGIVLAFVLAWATFHFVEKRIRFNKTKEVKIVSSLMGLLIVVLFLGFTLNHETFKGRLSGPVFDQIVESKHNYNEKRSGDPIYSFKGISEKTALFLGDSHMGMLWPRFEMLFQQNVLPKLSARFEEKSAGWKGLGEWCRLAAADPNVSKVVLSYFWESERFHGQADSHFVNKEFKNVISMLVSANKKVIMISSFPSGEVFSPNFLLDRIGGRVLSEREAPKPKIKDIRAASEFRLKPMLDIARNLGVEIIDPIDYLCDKHKGVCPVTLDGDSLFFDSNHIRPKYARKISWLDRLVLEN